MTSPVSLRWQAFLARVQCSYDELMAEAVVGCLGRVDVGRLDPMALSNVWSGVRAQVFALVEKISRAWVDTAQRAFELSDVSVHERAEQHAKGRLLAETLLVSVARAEVELFADAARFALAVGLAQPDAASEGPSTFEPGIRLRHVKHVCVPQPAPPVGPPAWDPVKQGDRRRQATRNDDFSCRASSPRPPCRRSTPRASGPRPFRETPAR